MNKEIKTDNFTISENSPAYIIEIGINHNGQYELAKQLIVEITSQKQSINPNPIDI